MTTVNQKEYLKKYLGIGKAPGEKKKKKKKEKIIGNKLKIIDDDADVLMSQEVQDDIAAANEDAPQIVAVIDERPPSLRIDEETKSNLWIPIGENSNISDIQSLKLSSSFKLGKQTKIQNNLRNPNNFAKHEIYEVKNYSKVKVEKEVQSSLSRSDLSPSRSRGGSDSSQPRQYLKSEESSPRVQTERNSSYKDDDHSPPRKGGRDDGYLPSKTKRKEDHDYSPPRRRNREDNISPLPKRENMYVANSPPRRKQKSYDYTSTRNRDNSSPSKRENNEDDDSSPKRENRLGNSPPKKRYRDDDNSPPRRKHGDNVSPPRERNRKEKSSDKDNSPPRRTNRSPPRKKDRIGDSSPRRRYDEDVSFPRMRKEESYNSPPRKNKQTDGKQKKSRWGNWNPEASPEKPEKSDEKMRKTLDGKKAGLQNAKDLVKETTLLRRREDEMFKKLSTEVSGMNAATIVRGKKVRDLEEEARQKENEKKTKEKYDRWGKGLKQIDDQNEKMAEQLHEMSKPLARYADDEDLEKYLKEQEREGDPMLAYIRKKKRKETIAAGTSEKPVYMGEFMPNRFGIPPGYRWDGVDRSSGYEKKWFQVQNSKQASQEEAFKWSTEDM